MYQEGGVLLFPSSDKNWSEIRQKMFLLEGVQWAKIEEHTRIIKINVLN